MKPSPEFVIYLLGIALLAFVYQPMKSALGGQWLFLFCGLLYLVFLRVVGSIVARILHSRQKDDT